MTAASSGALPPTPGNDMRILAGEIQLPTQQPKVAIQPDLHLQNEANEVATRCLGELRSFIESSKNEPLNERIAFPSLAMADLIKKIDSVRPALLTGESSVHNAMTTLKGALGEFEAEQAKYNFKKEHLDLRNEKVHQFKEIQKEMLLLVDEEGFELDGKGDELDQLEIQLGEINNEIIHLNDLLTSLPDVDRAFLQNKIEFNSTTNQIQPKDYKGKTISYLTPQILKTISAVAAQNIGHTVPVSHDEIEGVRFNVTKEQSGDVRIVQIGAKLGEGSWGVVSESLNITEGKEGAYKEAIRGRGDFRDKRAVEDLRKEYEISSKLHDLGHAYGLPPKPTKFTYLKTGEVALESKKFDSSYEQPSFPDEKTTYAAFHQLICGLHSLSSVNILHRDIKSANMLIDASGRVCLADMGGVVDAGKEKLDDEDIKGIFGAEDSSTPEILCSKDLDKLKEIEQRYFSCFPRFDSSIDPKEREAIRKESQAIIKEGIELGKKMDVFALGIALYERFAAHLSINDDKPRPASPYFVAFHDGPRDVDTNQLSSADRRPHIEEAYRDIEPRSDAPISNDAPTTHKDLNDLIKWMVNPDSSKRPTPIEVRAKFEQIMSQDTNDEDLFDLFAENRKRFVG